ncbi:hypothetical protein BRI6_1318 [plant metagenome]|uniref:Uncharacterized protein n=1 Tax=plant metagenome TaxID=1297885 RepID=A0A484TAS3_9ZZZZ
MPSPNHSGPAISTPRFQASKKALWRSAEMPFFPHDLIDDFLRQ